VTFPDERDFDATESATDATARGIRRIRAVLLIAFIRWIPISAELDASLNIGPPMSDLGREIRLFAMPPKILTKKKGQADIIEPLPSLATK